MKKYLIFIYTLFAISYSLKAELSYDTSINYLTAEKTKKSTENYYPYGKVLRKLENPRSRFQSTDHETDSETGYNNRNARWYDDESFQFLQVDPMGSKYPSFSPYHYVARNPIRLTDPSGKWIPGYDDNGLTLTAEEGDNRESLVKFWGN